MKNNPFITVLLLICIEIGLFYYLNYTKSQFLQKEGVFVGIFLTIPVVSLGLSSVLDNNPYQKKFQGFSVFLVIVAIIAFAVISYLSALGHAYQH